VDDGLGVHGDECAEDAAHDDCGVVLGVLALLADALEELAAAEVLEHEVNVVLRLVHLVQLDYVLVVQLPQQCHLLQQRLLSPSKAGMNLQSFSCFC
jgi:hypothetical protein